MKKILIKIIQVYQKTLSPDHGMFNRNPFIGCRYYPSCSEYAVQSIDKHGVCKGSAKSVWRVLRCNPFTKGGVDEVK